MAKHIWKKSIILLFLFVISCVFLVSCQKDNVENVAFNSFMTDLFTARAGSSTLTKNYTLIHPENYGITSLPSTLGTITASDFIGQRAGAENVLSKLKTYPKETLSDQQFVVWQTLKKNSEQDIAGVPFTSFYHLLSPSNGIQAQLPILLCEYHIHDKEDIEEYFALLNSMPAYFESIVAWERQSLSSGTFFTSKTCHDIIEQCRAFIKNPEENILITSFQNRLSSFSFLTLQEKQSYQVRNRQSVQNDVIPAYEALIRGLETSLPQAPADGGLASRPGGTAYYSWLVHNETGSRHDVPTLKKKLSKVLSSSLQKLAALESKTTSESAFSQVLSAGNPNQQIEHLKKSITKDFPAISKTSTKLHYVDPSLEEFLSPAFYLTPPVDDTSSQSIYINRSKLSSGNNLYATLAHEGYPGHLYQNAYLKEHQCSPLQSTLSFGGYTEGWATYAELYSYRYSQIPAPEQTRLIQSTLFSLALYSLCDIGVNYEGWNYSKCHHFLEDYGITDVEKTSAVYHDVIADPASYLKYSVGYLEITELKQHIKKLLGNTYSDMKFHTFFLDCGPTWFSILWETADKNLS